MTISVICPRCQNRQMTDLAMAGQAITCRCGQILIVPPASEEVSRATEAILVQCAACSRRYGAKPSLAGSVVRCSCGEAISIPGAPLAIPPSPLEPVRAPASGGGGQAGGATDLPGVSPSGVMDLLAMDSATTGEGPPVVLTSSHRGRRRKKGLLLVAAVAVAASMLVFVLAWLSHLAPSHFAEDAPKERSSSRPPQSSTPWGSYSWCIPPTAKTLAFVNVEKVFRSRAHRFAEALFDMDRSLGGSAGGWREIADLPLPSLAFSTFRERVREYSLAVLPDGGKLRLVSTTADMSPDDARLERVGLTSNFAIGPFQSTPQEGVFEKLGQSKFLVADRAWDIGAARTRRDAQDWLAGARRDAPDQLVRTRPDEQAWLARQRRDAQDRLTISDGLCLAWESAPGDVRVALLAPGPVAVDALFAIPGLPDNGAGSGGAVEAEWIGVGITLDSGFSLRAALGLLSEADAKNCASRFDIARRRFEARAIALESQLGQLPSPLPPRAVAGREFLAKARRMLPALHFSQQGRRVQLSGTWSIEDVEELIRLDRAIATTTSSQREKPVPR